MTAILPDTAGRIVVGIGFASAATPDEVIGLVEVCLAEAGFHPGQLAAVGTHMRKQSNPLPDRVAQHFAVPLRLFDEHDLADGLPGVAEAVAALAGPLHLGKRKSRYATCAIALCGRSFSLLDFGQPPRASAVMASSIVATSSAGP